MKTYTIQINSYDINHHQVISNEDDYKVLKSVLDRISDKASKAINLDIEPKQSLTDVTDEEIKDFARDARQEAKEDSYNEGYFLGFKTGWYFCNQSKLQTKEPKEVDPVKEKLAEALESVLSSIYQEEHYIISKRLEKSANEALELYKQSLIQE